MHGNGGNKPPSRAWHRMSDEQNKSNLFWETSAPIGKSSASPLRPSLGVFRMPRWFISPREYSRSSTIYVITWSSRIIFSLARWMAGQVVEKRKNKRRSCRAIELQEACGDLRPLLHQTQKWGKPRSPFSSIMEVSRSRIRRLEPNGRLTSKLMKRLEPGRKRREMWAWAWVVGRHWRDYWRVEAEVILMRCSGDEETGGRSVNRKREFKTRAQHGSLT